ncbi:hypothetical protein SAMN05421858_1842 [Haladaptatus litoreus]|uniref:DUF7969 domain-containing protein n=1 Tax=Haladaptatus litoreus TaxID=553468 RepID=A0A1N6Z2V2_9EURY|nr:hypothetical protein [Haladaptatus litoreus]SIR21125.1 hypothetical protein SAMN05421858_1842 [Haladaptatus litoreus]
MTVPVRYYCPHCGAIATLERDANLADKSVTADPLDGWEYANAYDDFEDADGVQIVCGGLELGFDSRQQQESEIPARTSETDEDGCGELYYLNFVKFEDGEELDPHVPLRPEDAPNFDFRT